MIAKAMGLIRCVSGRYIAGALGALWLLNTVGFGMAWAIRLPQAPSVNESVPAAAYPAVESSVPGLTPSAPPPMPAADATAPVAVVQKMKNKTVYHDLPGIVILPIPPINSNKAFSDASTVMANELAVHLQRQHPDTRIHSPGLIADALKRQGYSKTLAELTHQVRFTGAPSPATLGYVLDAIDSLGFGADVSRVVFVDTDMDTNRPDRSWHWRDVANHWLTDSIPSDNRYYLNTHLRVFDTESPHLTCVFSGSWIHPVKTNRFGNVTASVFDDGDSLNAITGASGMLSKALVLRAPRDTYARPVQTQVPVVPITTRVFGKIKGQP